MIDCNENAMRECRIKDAQVNACCNDYDRRHRVTFRH